MKLLHIRAPYLRSLHICAIQELPEKELPCFESLSELCLADSGADLWITFFEKMSEKNEKKWKLNKLCVDLGGMVKDESSCFQMMRKAIKLVLNPPRLSASKYIRLKVTFPSGWDEFGDRIAPGSTHSLFGEMVQALGQFPGLWKGEKFNSICLHLDIFFTSFQGDVSLASGTARELDSTEVIQIGKDISMGISSLLFWLERIGKKYALSIAVNAASANALSQWLKFLAGDARYSVLKSKKHYGVLLVVSSKNWDFCVANEKWEVDCKACELDLFDWETGERVWDARYS